MLVLLVRDNKPAPNSYYYPCKDTVTTLIEYKVLIDILSTRAQTHGCIPHNQGHGQSRRYISVPLCQYT